MGTWTVPRRKSRTFGRKGQRCRRGGGGGGGDGSSLAGVATTMGIVLLVVVILLVLLIVVVLVVVFGTAMDSRAAEDKQKTFSYLEANVGILRLLSSY
jgi:uncharacterized membrane protein